MPTFGPVVGEAFDPKAAHAAEAYVLDASDAMIDLGDGPKRVYTKLFRIAVTADRRKHGWYGYVFAGAFALSSDLGKSEQSIRRDLKALALHGLITISRPNRHLNNEYRFLWHPWFQKFLGVGRPNPDASKMIRRNGVIQASELSRTTTPDLSETSRLDASRMNSADLSKMNNPYNSQVLSPSSSPELQSPVRDQSIKIQNLPKENCATEIRSPRQQEAEAQRATEDFASAQRARMLNARWTRLLSMQDNAPRAVLHALLADGNLGSTLEEIEQSIDSLEFGRHPIFAEPEGRKIAHRGPFVTAGCKIP
jgi:hypothetical protein